MRADPIRFEPVARPKVWGGRRMTSRLGRDLPPGRPIGECWEVSARPEAATPAITGPRQDAPPDVVLGAPFPLLVKVLDASATLSVQVHPDAETARAYPGAEPKHEAWVVLDVDPGARIYRGFVDGIRREDVAEALREGTVEETLHSFEPRPGDVIEVAPGTVHAIGAGCLLLEVQQPSDTTYRVWDWGRLGFDGRPRELHVEPALASFRFEERGSDRVGPTPLGDGRERLIDAPVLRCDRARVAAGDRVTLEGGRVVVVSNVGGETVRLAGDSLPLRFGESALLLPEATVIEVTEGGPADLLLTSAEVPR